MQDISIGIAVEASTHRISVGIRATETTSGICPSVVPAMVAKAKATSDLLAKNRLISGESAWAITSPAVDQREMTDLADPGRAIVAPVKDFDDLRRVAALRKSLNDPSPRTRRRSTAAKSRRRPGINYDAIRQVFRKRHDRTRRQRLPKRCLDLHAQRGARTCAATEVSR